MSYVPPVRFQPSFLDREMDITARGLLREDVPNYWNQDQLALSNLLVGAGSMVLEPTRFDLLFEDDKFIVVALARHVLGRLSQRYVRKVAADEVPGHLHLGVNYPVMYFASEGLASAILKLARTPGSDGATVVDPPAAALTRALHDASTLGRLVNGGRLERLLQHAEAYHEDLDRTKVRRPVTSAGDLDSDDMHAFLCAYQTCFHD